MKTKERVILNWMFLKLFASKIIFVLGLFSTVFCTIVSFASQDVDLIKIAALSLIIMMTSNVLCIFTRNNILYELDDGRFRHIDSDEKKDIKMVRLGIIDR